jgi:hypothetical protein
VPTPYATVIAATALLFVLGFVGWWVNSLLKRDYPLSTALVTAAIAGVVAAEVAYRLLGWVLFPSVGMFGPPGPPVA